MVAYLWKEWLTLSGDQQDSSVDQWIHQSTNTVISRLTQRNPENTNSSVDYNSWSVDWLRGIQRTQIHQSTNTVDQSTDSEESREHIFISRLTQLISRLTQKNSREHKSISRPGEIHQSTGASISRPGEIHQSTEAIHQSTRENTSVDWSPPSVDQRRFVSRLELSSVDQWAMVSRLELPSVDQWTVVSRLGATISRLGAIISRLRAFISRPEAPSVDHWNVSEKSFKSLTALFWKKPIKEDQAKVLRYPIKLRTKSKLQKWSLISFSLEPSKKKKRKKAFSLPKDPKSFLYIHKASFQEKIEVPLSY